MITEGNYTLGGEHTIQYTEVKLYIMLYTLKLYNAINQCYPNLTVTIKI